MSQVSASTLTQRFPTLLKHHSGDAEAHCTQPCSPQQILAESIVFAGTKSDMEQALASQAAIVVVPNPMVDLATDTPKTILLSPNTKLAMAFVNREYFDPSLDQIQIGDNQIHATAVLGKNVSLGNNVVLSPNVVVYDNVIIGDNTHIGPNTVIEAQSIIGSDCHIHAQVYIGSRTEIGNQVEVQPNSSIGTEGFGYAFDENRNSHRVPHLGKVVIHDNVHIGANVNIDKGTYGETVVGKGTKFDNHAHVAHNVKIGEHCMITAGFIVAGSTTIGSYNMFSGRSGLNGHINVGDNIILHPCSTVAGNLTEPGEYSGYPLQKFKEWRKSAATIRKLPQMREDLNNLKKKK